MDKKLTVKEITTQVLKIYKKCYDTEGMSKEELLEEDINTYDADPGPFLEMIEDKLGVSLNDNFSDFDSLQEMIDYIHENK